MDANDIIVTYNAISKEIEVKGLDIDDFDGQVMDIHSLSHKCGLKASKDLAYQSVRRKALEKVINPVADYLNKCHFLYDEEGGYIDKVCDALKTKPGFNNELKKILVTKWLLNAANIAFNNGHDNSEGCLVLQGEQGCGKTTFIKKIVPYEFLKTGLSLDPSDKDSVRQSTRYWVAELGELDSTMKSDQAKLKAFLTESVDEYRLPYAISPKRYPRTTIFYGSVNKEDFLKDETGSRRFWIIPVDDVDNDSLDDLDMDQLWGEVMHLLEKSENSLNLTRDELIMLESSNEEFNIKGNVEIAVSSSFAWDTNKEDWIFTPTTEIARKLGLKSTAGLKNALIKEGAEYKVSSIGGKRVRGYRIPQFMMINGGVF